MVKRFFLVLSLLGIVLLTACNARSGLFSQSSGEATDPRPPTHVDSSVSHAVSSGSSSSSDASSLLTEEEKREGYEYIYPLLFGLGQQSWENPGEIDPDLFVEFYLSWITNDRLRQSLPPEDKRNQDFGGDTIWGEDLEAAVRSRFVIDVDAIRQSSYYDPHTGTYRHEGICPLFNRYELVSFQRKDDKLVLAYQLFTPSEAEAFCTLTVKPKEDGFFYDGYAIEWVKGKPDDFAPYYRYVLPFAYDIGAASWESAQQIQPDALVIYYFSQKEIGEISLPLDGPRDVDFGNLLIPAKVLESAVMRHFTVDADRIRQSNYYDPDTNSYWTGGIGSMMDVVITDVRKENDDLVIEFYRRSPSGTEDNHGRSVLTMKLDQEGQYRYLAFSH